MLWFSVNFLVCDISCPAYLLFFMLNFVHLSSKLRSLPSSSTDSLGEIEGRVQSQSYGLRFLRATLPFVSSMSIMFLVTLFFVTVFILEHPISIPVSHRSSSLILYSLFHLATKPYDGVGGGGEGKRPEINTFRLMR